MFLSLFQAHLTGKNRRQSNHLLRENKRTLPVYADCKQISKETPKKSLKNHTLKGLVEETSGITIEKGAHGRPDIDESGSRYIDFFVKGLKKSVIVRQVSFTLSGKVAYRVAASKGNDFYPRTDLGENQRAVEGTQQITLPVNITVKPNERLAYAFSRGAPKQTDSCISTSKDSHWKVWR